MNVSAKDLIRFAYHVHSFQSSGGPSWINSGGYDIEAKVDDSVVAQLQKLPQEQRMDQFRLMLRSLLADRFKLNVNFQTKELPIYALVVAKGGPKLTLTAGKLDLPPGHVEEPPACTVDWSPGRIKARMIRMSALAQFLGNEPDLGGRLVVDKTRLQGKYDFTLEFAPEMAQFPPGTEGDPRSAGGPPGPLHAPPPPDPNAPSIFTAIQEQLGLKLESTKGPVEVLVIEGIERPSEN